MESERRLLRHFVATLAYRTQKALRHAPPEFASFRVAPGTRTPHEIVRHMNGVLNYALGLITTPRALLETLPEFAEEIRRFHALLEALAARLVEDFEFSMELAERLLQGPLADAMTHAGQLTMLRRLAGSPVPPENFFLAAIDAENVGPEQSLPVSPDREWPEAPAGWRAPTR
ncbi:MAG TPA: hypothetical protein VFJ24_04865 [Gaiellales bacterium]|nr:hypothetical protein [Gaiellales bacterium]